MQPTRRTILLASSGLVLALLPAFVADALWTFWVVFWGLVLFGLGLDFLLAPPRRSATHTVEAPEVLYVGEPGTATLTLHIRSTGVVPFEAVVDFSENLSELEPLTGTFSSSAPARLTVPLHSRRRGTASIEAFWVRYRGPLGLIEFTIRFPVGHEMSIVPNILPVRRAALRFLDDRTFQVGLRIEKYKGDGTEFDSLREFVEGDDTRSIHWRSSARHRSILCRQFRAERNHQVIFVVDSGRLMSEPLGGTIPKVDHAVSAALLLAYVSLKSGDRVGLYSFDARVGRFVAPQGGMGHYRVLAHLTGEIEYSDLETNFTLGLTTLTQRLRRRSLIVVLTDFVDTITAELMLENLGRLAKKHVVVFVSLRDPELQRLSRERPVGVVELNRAVVANSYLHDRHVVLKRLERMGLFSIDSEPDRMGPELINRYLEIKRRELV